MKESSVPQRKPAPTLAMIDVNTIVSTCMGIEECLNTIPHSYIFSPAMK